VFYFRALSESMGLHTWDAAAALLQEVDLTLQLLNHSGRLGELPRKVKRVIFDTAISQAITLNTSVAPSLAQPSPAQQHHLTLYVVELRVEKAQLRNTSRCLRAHTEFTK
jgi:hypothetical protein